MWTLLVLCSVIASHGVQGGTTEEMNPKTSVSVDATYGVMDSAVPGVHCGGNLFDSMGTFASPNFPNPYPVHSDCIWYITPSNGTVQLDFPFVNIEYMAGCGYDAIYVFDGPSIHNRLLGTVCGSHNSTTFFSTGTSLTVRFRSDGSVNLEGFHAYYYVRVSGNSCRNSCSYSVGNCSCSSICRYNGNCCPDYEVYCSSTTTPSTETAGPSCRYNCGGYMGSCSCSSSCQYYGNCCHDYTRYCQATTQRPPITARPSCYNNCGGHMGSCSCTSSCQYYGNCCYDYYTTCLPTTQRPTAASCRYNCGRDLGNCSCSSSCRYYGNCCYDYTRYCQATTQRPPITAGPSCRYNCGRDLGRCSCSSSCRYYGNCCYDYTRYCQATTQRPPVTARPSCRYNCGGHMGSCSCSSSCQYYGNCCYDYNRYCQYTTRPPVTASCRYNCGGHMGSCSCSSSCRYNGNCCYDYTRYCQYTTRPPVTAGPSCRYNCGRDLGRCSCSSSCQYYGNCCHDYYSYCQYTTQRPPVTGSACGGSLFGSGTFSSPNHPNHYYDNAFCVWQLRAAGDQRLFLSFMYLQLENCCTCDFISVYDGPSVNSRYLGKVCNDSLSTFYSSSNYLTVVFRTDSSVVARGFIADFRSTLPPSSGRVDCSSGNMNIVIKKAYLDSLGYDGNSLYLNDPHCRPYISSYEVAFNFPINQCGNTRKFENGRFVYTNSLRAYTSGSGSGEITHRSHLKMNVACRMDPESIAQILYVVRHHENSTITGTGRFNTSMDFYTSSNFYYRVSEVPYMVTLNQNLYVQVDLGMSDSSLVLFLDTCVTSPSPYDFQSRAYYLVRNGCPMDNSYYAYNSGTRDYARFRFRAFQFLRATESVYIQCKVLICQSSDYNSRCRRGCSRRAARDLGAEHDSHTLVMGPIQLKDPEKETPEQDKA